MATQPLNVTTRSQIGSPEAYPPSDRKGLLLHITLYEWEIYTSLLDVSIFQINSKSSST